MDTQLLAVLVLVQVGSFFELKAFGVENAIAAILGVVIAVLVYVLASHVR